MADTSQTSPNHYFLTDLKEGIRSFGRLIGAEPGRGIAPMFIVSGVMIALIAILIGRNPTIKRLESV